MNDDSPKHRWYRYSLKTLLIVVTVATVVFGIWVQNRRNRAQENRDGVAAATKAIETAVAAIEDLGGEVTSAYEERRPQTWLEKQFDDPGDADDPIGVLKVTDVSFEFDEVTDAELEHVKALTHLQTLRLYSLSITDAGVEHLKGLKSLQELLLGYTKITDVGLEHLKGLTNLQELDLQSTKVTDAGLEHLKGMKNLSLLSLQSTNVTDAGLEHLRGLTNLRQLLLLGTNVTDEGVKKLQQALPNCKIHRR